MDEWMLMSSAMIWMNYRHIQEMFRTQQGTRCISFRVIVKSITVTNDANTPLVQPEHANPYRSAATSVHHTLLSHDRIDSQESNIFMESRTEQRSCEITDAECHTP